jgi:diguanylate cyclase (GGDEF)-like protein
MRMTDKNEPTLADFLNQVPILEGMSFLERQAVADCLKPVCLERDQVLFNEGDRGTGMYIVRSGIIGGYKRLSDGTRIEMGRFSHGRFFGEMSMMDGKPRSLTCYALTAAELLAMEGGDFRRLVGKHPMIGHRLLKAMLRAMSSRLNEADNLLNSMVLWGAKARSQTIVDPLTGLHNKRYFEEEIAARITKSGGRRFCLLICDVDNFHSMNRSWGAETGDMMLKIVAELFRTFFPPTAVIARLGGDEFAVLLPDTGLDQAAGMAQDVKNDLQFISQNMNAGGVPLDVPITLSVGLSEYPAHGTNAAELIKKTDEALFAAKKLGKNRVTRVK